MKTIIAIMIGLGIAKFLFWLGASPLVMAVLATTALLFWSRVMRATVGVIRWLSRFLAPSGQMQVAALDGLADWLVENENVAAPRNRTRENERSRYDGIDSDWEPVEEPAVDPEILSEAKALFEDLAMPCVYLVKQGYGPGEPKSKVGGFPSLPEGTVWPHRYDQPLHFIAEIHLCEVPRGAAPEGLPKTGVLFFFGDLSEWTDYETGAVIYAAQEGEQVLLPEDLAELGRGFVRGETPNELAETPIRPMMLPFLDPDKINYIKHSEEFLRALDGHTRKTYRDRINDANLPGQAQLSPSDDGYCNHMIGGPKFTAPNPTDGQGVKLLQLDSDHGLGLQFGDMGILEFWIDPDDLKAGRYDKAVMTASSC